MMSLLLDFRWGISAYGRAIELIIKNKLYPYFAVPLLLNILLLGTTYALLSNFTDYSLAWVQGSLNPEGWDFWGARFLESTINFLLHVILHLFFFLLYAFTGGYIILIVLSPLLSYISEKTERILIQTDYPFSWKQIVKDSWRGILLAVRNFFLETAAIIILFIMSFIPVIGLATTPLLFIISAYFYGFSFMDYTSERRKLSSKESIAYVKQNKGMAIGNGIPFALCLLIPFVGVSLAGFVAIISAVAATLSIFQKEQTIEQNSI